MNKIDVSIKTDLVKKYLPKAVSYSEYYETVGQHAQNGTTTGELHSEALVNYTKLNNSRMKRLAKTVRVPEEIQKKFIDFIGKQTWLVITESWCGDAAQSMPAMNILAELTPNIDLKVILRDENPELMDAFLTNGTRGIPKLIVLDGEKDEVIGEWGPRPSIATQMAFDYKAVHGKLTPEFKQDLQVWYNNDKSQNIIEDLAGLLD
ncbi:MAG: thioredoxin family protein [Flavobacteriaceae bacterium]|nr:thioredoxin family protein [Flavobacteriaceae bacterium]